MVPRETFSIQHYISVEPLFFSELFSLPGVEQSPWRIFQGGRIAAWIEKNSRPNAYKIQTQDGLVLSSQKIATETGHFVVLAGSYIASPNIEFRDGVTVEPGAYVRGPAIIGEGTVIRQGAYVRGDLITGKDCVVGHTTEVKNSIFCNKAKAGHFVYIGDSILGHDVNLGAGTKISNLKMSGDEIVLNIEGEKIPSGMRKFGAIVGDRCETGCNSVLNPGVLLAPECRVYPAIAAKKGYYPPKTLIKS